MHLSYLGTPLEGPVHTLQNGASEASPWLHQNASECILKEIFQVNLMYIPFLRANYLSFPVDRI